MQVIKLSLSNQSRIMPRSTYVSFFIWTQNGFFLKDLFVCCLLSRSRIFHSYGDVTIAGEGLQILTYARHSWPLSSEGFLLATPTVTRGFVYNGHLREPVILTPIAERSAVDLSLHLFLRLRSVAAEIRTPNLPLAGPTL